MSGDLTFETVIEQRGPAAAVLLTEAQVAELGGGLRAPVALTIDGVTERLRLARMGGEVMIGLRKEVRDRLGVEAGDRVMVMVAVDEAPREVEVPAELAAALAADAAAWAFYDGLAPSHRKAYAQWVGEAKAATTRGKRAAAALEMLRAGTKRP